VILILSKDGYEPTTELVQDWIEFLGGDCVRLNGEDMNGGEPFALRYGPGDDDATFRVGGRVFTKADVGAVWLRRWHRYENIDFPELGDSPALRTEMQRHLMRELQAATHSLPSALGGAPWLTHPDETRANKLHALRAASGAGLDVPATIVTNSKRSLQEFKDRHGRVVTKCVGDVTRLQHRGKHYVMYTAEITQEVLDAAPETFFPSLAQEYLAKAYELRTFYLDGRCWTMAIFSQLDRRTELDFRHYDKTRPNRTVPYRLEPTSEQAVARFMGEMGLTTGSIDLVRTIDGRTVFLEVNPAGQFAMISAPCNYFLERRVAEHLIRRDADADRPAPALL
jgi:ATP-GRASP peptide maturase of grasp-with-spasm system